MVGHRSAIIGITLNTGQPMYDRTVKRDLLHIVGIEEMPKAPPANGPAS
jgi:hypothetical protein